MDSALDAGRNLATGVATGAGHLGAALLSPADLAYDAIQGQKLGTSNRVRRESIDSFGRDNADTDSINYMAGGMVPELAATGAPIAGAGRMVASVLPKALGRLAPAAGDIAVNSAYEAGKAMHKGEDVGRAAAYGAAGAAGGRLLARTLGGIAKPFISQEARALMDAGVTPTPGQLFGDGPVGSTIRGIEDKATSLPIAGDLIQHARGRGVREFGNAEINKALAPIGVKVGGAGQDAIEQASRAVSDAYDRALPNIYVDPKAVVQVLPEAMKTIEKIPLLTVQQQAQVVKYVADKITPTVREAAERGTTVSGDVAKQIDSEIGYLARKYTSSINPSDHPFGDAMYVLQGYMRDSLKGQTSEAVQQLAAANRAFAGMVPIVRAADKAAAKGGVFTPNQLDRAARANNRSATDLTRAGQAVLSSNVPDSGSAGRLLMGGALGGAFPSMALPPSLMVAMLYSKVGTRGLVDGLGVVIPRGADPVEAVTREAMRSPELAAQLGRMLAAHGVDEQSILGAQHE